MIGIVFINDINLCPYISKYIDAMNNLNVKYELIIWDRTYDDSKIYKYPCKHIYKKNVKENVRPVLKLKDFYLFFRFVKKTIQKQKYEKLIILTTLSGVFLYDLLVHNYRGKFIFDYRDASYEFLPLYNQILKKLVRTSAFTCISSSGFKKILPQNENYIVAHNFRYEEVEKRSLVNDKNNTLPIKVSYIGLLRGTGYMIRLINIFKSDKRFVLYIHGGGENLEELRGHAKGFENVILTGKYDDKKKLDLIKNCDILCYNYESSFVNNHAVANKYYYSLIYKKPLLGNINTYSGKLIEKNGIGISLDFKDTNYTDKVFEYYTNYDYEEFSKNAEVLLQKVLHEDKIYINKIHKFISDNI